MAELYYVKENRFTAAASKFPRFMNIKRRPKNSISGKLLYSIIDRIAEVEDAITEYKKDFFIKNYDDDKTNKMIAYLYQLYIGDVNEDLLEVTEPDLPITTDTETFYNDCANYILYQEGYLVFYHEPEHYIQYTYNNKEYKTNTYKKTDSDDVSKYMYVADVGDLLPSQINVTMPNLKVTTNKTLLDTYPNTYAYFNNGSLYINTNPSPVRYTVDSYGFSGNATRVHIWNIFDEFAWWAGLTRFDDEENAALKIRTMAAFWNRGNSTEAGLKNVIQNALKSYGDTVEDNDIVFSTPNEDNMILENDSGQTFYEEISEFNHDISSSKRWDIDYWQNDFIGTDMIPHSWDYEVENYKDGVGYNDSLKISTVKDLDNELGTDLTVKGYKKSETKISNYIQSKNITKPLTIQLKKYLDTMNPKTVTAKVTASELTKINKPKECTIDISNTAVRKASYALDTMVVSSDNIETLYKNEVEEEALVEVTLKPVNNHIDVSTLQRVGKNGVTENLIDQLSLDRLTSVSAKRYLTLDSNGHLVNKKEAFYGTNVYDFVDTVNVVDKAEGMGPQNSSSECEFYITTNVKDDDTSSIADGEIALDIDCKEIDVTRSSFVKTNNFVYDESSNQYILNNAAATNDENASITIEFSGTYLSYTIPRSENGNVKIETIITRHPQDETATITEGDLKNTSTVASVLANHLNVVEDTNGIYADFKIVISKIHNYNDARVENIKIKRVRSYVTVRSFDNNGNNTSDITYLTQNKSGAFLIPKNIDYHIMIAVYDENKTKDDDGAPYLTVKSIAVKTTGNVKEEYKTTFNAQLKDKIVFEGDAEISVKVGGELIDYSNDTEYWNNTSKNQYLYITTEKFQEIYSSNPQIKTDNNGNQYIILKPDQRIIKIEIYGLYEQVIESGIALTDIINRQLGNTKDEDKIVFNEYVSESYNYLYVNSNLESFVIRNEDSAGKVNSEQAIVVDKDNVSSEKFNTLSVTMDTSDKVLTTCFIVEAANNTKKYTNKYSGTFESFYIYDPSASTDHIGYIREDVVQETTTTYTEDGETKNLTINSITSFSPKLDSDKKYVYQIDNGDQSNLDVTTDVRFLEGESYWSSRNDQLFIEIDVNYDDIDNYIRTEELTLVNNFTVSNNIKLEDTYEINGSEVELGEYILTLPNNLALTYSNVSSNTYSSYVEDDGFNKLPYSNVVSIDRLFINGAEKTDIDSLCSLSVQSGFVKWNMSSVKSGDTFKIIYTYQKPKYVTFNNIDDLYEIISYDINALQLMTNDQGKEAVYTLEDVKSGDVIDVDYEEFVKNIDVKISLKKTATNDIYTIENNKCYSTIEATKITKIYSITIDGKTIKKANYSFAYSNYNTYITWASSNIVENATTIVIECDYIDDPENMDTPDKVVAICDNDVYRATVKYDKISISKVADDNTLVVHNGYYYIDGNEYWYFSEKNHIDASKVDGITQYNTVKGEDSIALKQTTTNYLKNSKMARNIVNATTIFNFENSHSVPNISSTNHVGACETLSSWFTHDMEMEPYSDNTDNTQIQFTANSSDSFAILEVTSMLEDATLFTAMVSGNIVLTLAKEIYIDGESIKKTTYIEKVSDFTRVNDIAYCDCSDCDTDNYRYYIIVTKTGIIAEMISGDKSRFLLDNVYDYDLIRADYDNVLTKLGVELEEESIAGTKNIIEFSPVNMTFNGLEIDKDSFLQTGSSIDWGFTKIKDFDLSNDIVKTKFTLVKDYLLSNDKTAYITTKPIALNYVNSIKELILKINDYEFNNMKNFTIEVSCCSTKDGKYNKITTVKNTNIVKAYGTALSGYVKFKISGAEKKRIDHLELFAQYYENESETVPIYTLNSGTAITKVFDIGKSGDYSLSSIELDNQSINMDSAKYYVRGLKFNNNSIVYTSWYEFSDTDNHVFDDYRYFQFKVEIDSSDTKLKINNFIMEATS